MQRRIYHALKNISRCMCCARSNNELSHRSLSPGKSAHLLANSSIPKELYYLPRVGSDVGASRLQSVENRAIELTERKVRAGTMLDAAPKRTF